MDRSGRITVVGATGFTGRLVARELAASGLPYRLSARSPSKLARLAEELGAETGVADVRDGRALQGIMAPGDVVINCAGPFSDLGEDVIRACLASRVHYLDTTGEQRFMMRVRERYGATAAEAGVVVLNALAFEFALGDAAAALAADPLPRPLRSLDVVYAVRSGAGATSPGTRLSILRILARWGYGYRGGAWQLEPLAARRRRVRLPDGRTRTAVSFPAGEILTVPGHVSVDTVRAWIVVGRWLGPLLSGLGPGLPLVIRAARPLFETLARRGPPGPSESQRRSGQFLIRAEAIAVDGSAGTVEVTGVDPYGITAKLCVLGARALLEAPRPAGVLAPAQLLAPRLLLDALRPSVEWSADGHRRGGE